MTSEAQLNFILRKAIALVPKLVEVQTLGVVAREIAEKAVAILGGTEAGADGAPHEAKTVHGAYRRPRVFLPAKGDVRASATVSRVVGGHAMVMVYNELGDVTILPEVLRLYFPPNICT